MDHPADEASQQKEYVCERGQKAVCAVKWMWCGWGKENRRGKQGEQKK